ncbi:MAG: hypothetical protein LBQ58_09920, partial [Synergistaceae bacterium]|nr:hypothetical protein [Synergistaceae bacterium]
MKINTSVALKRLLKIVCVLLLTLLPVSPLEARDVEQSVEDGIRNALTDAGLNNDAAVRFARQYLFIGTVMINDKYLDLTGDGRTLESRSMEAGYALGSALASAHKVYGGKKLQETANIMMHAVRAGVSPLIASGTYATLAEGGYHFEETLAILHETSEAVRVTRVSDGGEEFSKRVCALAAKRAPVNKVRKEIIASIDRERTRQKDLLARNERELIRKNRAKGGKDDSDPPQRGRSAAPSAATVSESGANTHDNASSSEADSSGSDTSGGDASGGNSSGGGDTSGGDASGGDSSGGGDASGGDASGGDSSGGGDTSGGDASGGDSSGGGDASGGDASGGD